MQVTRRTFGRTLGFECRGRAPARLFQGSDRRVLSRPGPVDLPCPRSTWGFLERVVTIHPFLRTRGLPDGGKGDRRLLQTMQRDAPPPLAPLSQERSQVWSGEGGGAGGARATALFTLISGGRGWPRGGGLVAEGRGAGVDGPPPRGEGRGLGSRRCAASRNGRQFGYNMALRVGLGRFLHAI